MAATRTEHPQDASIGIDLSSFGFELEFDASWRDVHDIERGTAEHMDGFYNPRRRHSHNSYLSPTDFEHQFMQQEIVSSFGVHGTGQAQ